jgi:hypothetical protein
MSWAFSGLLRPRGIRAPVPRRLVKTPRVSRYLAAAPQKRLSTRLRTSVFSLTTIPPPRQHFSAREFQPWRPDSCVQTNELSHKQRSSKRPRVERVDEGKVERGDICVEKEVVRVGIYARRHDSFPKPSHPRQTQTPSSRDMRHLHAEAKSCMVRKG